ncbi:hypothetical protein [Oceanirhabdus seepicola]|uniref:Uncharacterized protein n=1 Tax=Oceanirhabdus seepicola TaxID=2828781 RepID=A0A9J6P8F1_9CLOT|nr:hypothetical protein [Oceanirhabdus seepicola]MCM1991728.1 hypothetical protein [Oceanirhabdus seepicola]
MYMRNNNCDNGLYFMLGATMTALGCMGYCMCKNNGYLEKLSCNDSNGNGKGKSKRMLKMTGKRHLGHKCHHGHHRHEGHQEYQEYEGYQIPEDEFTNEMNSSQQNLHNQ